MNCVTCDVELTEDNKACEGDYMPMCIDCELYYEEQEENSDE